MSRVALALILYLTAAAGAAQGGLTTGLEQPGEVGTAPLPAPETDLPRNAVRLQVVDAPAAVLRGLDTLNGTVVDFEVRQGETVAFDRLQVSLGACRYPVGDAASEAFAYLVIRDRRESEPRFSGWMLASSPALSALDHPRYDVWVLNCKTE